MNTDMWLDNVSNFSEGFACVFVKWKGWTYINQRGEFIGNGKLWFYYACDFSGGFAVVNINNKRYRLDKKGILHEDR